MTTSVREARAHFYAAATSLQTDAREILTGLAMMAKTQQLAAAAAVGVHDRLRGVGQHGAKISVGYTIVGFTSPTAIVAWRGPAQLVNDPTAAHDIKPRRGRGHKAVIVGDGVVARSHTEGTRGKHFFEAGADATRVAAPAVAQRGVHRALLKHFTGD